MTAQSPLPRACGGCGFGEGTFAGVSGNDEDAPIAAIRRNARMRTCGPAALVQGEVVLALPIRLASTEDSVSYGARGIMRGNVNE